MTLCKNNSVLHNVSFNNLNTATRRSPLSPLILYFTSLYIVYIHFKFKTVKRNKPCGEGGGNKIGKILKSANQTGKIYQTLSEFVKKGK